MYVSTLRWVRHNKSLTRQTKRLIETTSYRPKWLITATTFRYRTSAWRLGFKITNVTSEVWDWELIFILLLIVLLFSLWRRSSKKLRLRRFKLDRDEIWQDCSSGKYASIDRVRFPIACDVMLSIWWYWKHHFTQKRVATWWVHKKRPPGIRGHTLTSIITVVRLHSPLSSGQSLYCLLYTSPSPRD